MSCGRFEASLKTLKDFKALKDIFKEILKKLNKRYFFKEKIVYICVLR